jgi:hypothetical protein
MDTNSPGEDREPLDAVVDHLSVVHGIVCVGDQQLPELAEPLPELD